MSKRKAKTTVAAALGLALSLIIFSACGSGTESGSSDSSTTDVNDNSVQMMETAESGSTQEINGKYSIDGTEGYYYLFSDNGVGVIQQDGTYENAEKTIDMKFDSSNAYTKYQKEKVDDGVKLITMIEGAKKQNEIIYTFVSGDDKLMNESAFNGIYKLAGSDDSRMIFHDDGKFANIQDFSYEIKDDQISIIQNGSESTYEWDSEDGKILLKTDDTVTTTLVPVKAAAE